ncbi:hypothetical protein LO767_02805 [Halopseudomonas aestusnigri]|uniref:transposase n=1 Tax=Halopseudomonas aestusnigri TaxID=857252 RepID=UPI001E50A41B|nr:transposase [Halopseudomonas aestusnigri]UGV31454.1 hypothetical protein LO767_02805 [Halopseudomonas aestusnigri]
MVVWPPLACIFAYFVGPQHAVAAAQILKIANGKGISMRTRLQGRPFRRSCRLRYYDYRAPAVCFVTLCTAGRRCLFGQIIDGQMLLSELGSLVRTVWDNSAQHASHVDWLDVVVMPNHLHGVLQIIEPAIAPTQEAFGAPVAGSFPTLIRSFKAAVTREARARGLLGADALWQPRFYEHLIRSEEEYQRIAEYVADNPRRWAEDRFYVS